MLRRCGRARRPASVIERFRDDFAALLRACRVSVSQAGYNTVLDLLAARARAVLVPFAAGRETEQLLRAERLAALGAAELVRESELSAAALAAAIERAAARPRPSLAIDTGGAARSARLIAEMIGARRGGQRPFAAPASRLLSRDEVLRRAWARCRAPRCRCAPVASMAAADWADLVAELDRWGEAGRVATLWWRDDDAVAATPQLATLLRVAGGSAGCAGGDPGPRDRGFGRCPGRRARRPGCCSTAGVTRTMRQGKKSEYPSGLSASVVAAEIAAGTGLPRRAVRVTRAAGVRAAVEPHRAGAARRSRRSRDRGPLDDRLANKTRAVRPPCRPGLALIDVHVDLTDWKGGRRFIGAAAALGALVAWLRRAGSAMRPPAGPIGILTHHLIMDRETAAFVEALLRAVAGHRAARWVDIAEMLR